MHTAYQLDFGLKTSPSIALQDNEKELIFKATIYSNSIHDSNKTVYDCTVRHLLNAATAVFSERSRSPSPQLIINENLS